MAEISNFFFRQDHLTRKTGLLPEYLTFPGPELTDKEERKDTSWFLLLP